MSEDPDKLLASIGDESEWGDAVPVRRGKRSEKRRRGVVISVRLAPEEFELLEGEAKQAGLPLGTFMRQRAIAAAAPAHSVHADSFPCSFLASSSAFAWHANTTVIEERPQLTNAG